MEKTEADYVALAADTTISGEQLELLWQQVIHPSFELGRAAGVRIQHVVAKNPNLTPTLATRCFGQLAPSLMENPALPLLMIESPFLANDSPVESLLRMTRRVDSPPRLLRILTQHPRPQVSEAARLHVALYGEASEAQVRQEIGALKVGGKEKLEQLYTLGLVPDWLAKKHRLKRITTPIQLPWSDHLLNDQPLHTREKAMNDALLHWAAQEYFDLGLSNIDNIWGKCPHQLFNSFHWHNLQSVFVPLDVLILLGKHEIVLLREDAPRELKALVFAQGIRAAVSVGLVVVLTHAHLMGVQNRHEAALSTRWLQRLGIALNPWTSDTDRRRLSEDANALVRAVARDAGLRERLLGRDDG